jgi:integrase
MKVSEQLHAVALERGLRPSTRLSYKTLLRRLDLLDCEVAEITREEVSDALWTIDNPNTRRSAIIAIRSVLGYDIKIPKGIPRRYSLPDEDTLRLALMISPHEVRGLLMMFAGLRIGEACAVTERAVSSAGNRLRVDKQVQQLHDTGRPSTCKITDVKSYVDDLVIPMWLGDRVKGITETAKPDCVRESLLRAGKKAGIHLNPHMLRHWYATTMLDRGAPMDLVSRQMRHSDVAVTMRTYSQSDAEVTIPEIFG